MSSACSSLIINPVQYYSTIVVDSCGMVFNLCCIVCFGQILRHKSDSKQANTRNLFNYLIIKAVCDFASLTLDTFSVLDLNNYAYYGSLLSYSIYYIYFYKDIEQILLMLSGLMEVLATLGIFFLIKVCNQITYLLDIKPMDHGKENSLISSWA
jgi:hypothetical protein